ncbi:alpha-amylase family glycosyl hydrolase [Amycolatopsis sp. PS_44_ISF1]|uniref:glycoside hydrolase family 13 protein n=1 Tax=Amycolatopsis sp. PS_44_ISF1 TaxID=2974917 RepID=UPI0028DFD8A5|nr:alpha-amylase family glycosyl hydrolase [Amycolatopsis sp. PS_44_ISF1]MDT8912211.1 glycoside hydrolase family 13 protein [Amycolatopsis sp. PS_44_ISF1]
MTASGQLATTEDSAWWRSAAIYQVYIRSFADGNGDGVGDLAGVRSRLDYLAELGVDAIWFTPWYPSPMDDGGYDVADFRDIEPLFGTLDEAGQLLTEAHERGIRVIIDIVPNHCSDEHRWFQEALAAGPGSMERQRFWFRPGRGPDGAQPPNNWKSRFGGPAWTRVTEADGTPGEWYLHLYSSRQPDFNWDNQDIRAEFEDVLRFWFDRGVDGFRIDVADGLVKDPALPDVEDGDETPFSDQEGLHEIYRSWRKISDSYPGEKILVGEMWLPEMSRAARYLRRDELHSAFNFDFLTCPWDPGRLRDVVSRTLRAHEEVGAPAAWVLSNHDVTRHVTRYGRAGDTGFAFADRLHGTPVDRGLGTRRARAAALLTLSLPGGLYVYQGEELGLWEVEDLPPGLRQDPVWARTQGADPGRDGCRVPIPWSGEAAPFGFGTGESWLPQPAEWASYTAEAEAGDPDSMLSLYRRGLALRPALGEPAVTWLDAGPEVLAFSRAPGFVFLLNFSAAPVPLPEHTGILLASGPLTGGRLPTDTAVWLRS